MAIGHAQIGAVSAAVLVVLLGVGVWAGTALLLPPRTSAAVTAGLVLLLDVQAFRPRAEPAYDERVALYGTDQVVSAPVSGTGPALSVIVEPVFAGQHPAFGVATDVGGTPVSWSCGFVQGRQRLILPLPPMLVGSTEVSVRLTGTPRRDGDYLLVFLSARRGGPLVDAIEPTAAATDGLPVTVCSAE